LPGVATIELDAYYPDAYYWDVALRPLPHEEWVRRQGALLTADRWIADGDLSPDDALPARLDLATHVVVLDPPLWLCCPRVL